MQTTHRPVLRVLLTALLGALATLGLVVPTASAHDRLIGSTPSSGATVAGAPSEVVLTFSGPVLSTGAAVAVTGPDGRAAADAAPEVSGTTVRQRLSGGVAGRYTVQWRVTSSDGHPIAGTFTFTARTGSSATGATTGGTAASSTTTATGPTPTRQVPSDSTTNSPVLIGGLTAAALLGLGVAALVARRRMRDDL